ncbi:MAG: C40 family peptidase [Verrucomicrobia bacterium]|nr:C40 family peptidase [Verrucomicrobiota bacterium]
MRTGVILLVFFCLAGGLSARADTPWEKIWRTLKKVFTGETPTPTPHARHHHPPHHIERPANPEPTAEAPRGLSPTPSPSPEPLLGPKASATPTPIVIPLVTPTPETKASPSLSPIPQSNQPSSQLKFRAEEFIRISNEETTPTPASSASVATLQPSDLRDFDAQPDKVRNLIRLALELTTRNLGYQYGSADPANGGMDCSGFIYYTLTQAGVKDVPRESDEQYVWVRKTGLFQAVLSRSSDSFELKQLQPGNLMFWSGTYKVEREIPITHVMIYLGLERKSGKPVMVGSSDGRSYEGIRRSGVSVFDFRLPNGANNKSDPELMPRFEGYGPIPGFGGNTYVAQNEETPSPKASPPKSIATGASAKKTPKTLLTRGD